MLGTLLGFLDMGVDADSFTVGGGDSKLRLQRLAYPEEAGHKHQ